MSRFLEKCKYEGCAYKHIVSQCTPKSVRNGYIPCTACKVHQLYGKKRDPKMEAMEAKQEKATQAFLRKLSNLQKETGFEPSITNVLGII